MTYRPTRLATFSTALVLGALAVAPAANASSGPDAGAAAKSASAKALALVPGKIKAGFDIRFANRSFAICSATDVTPSKKSTYINGKKYTLGTGLCPIVKGQTIFNASLQGKKPTVKGPSTVWSSFGNPATFPQYSAEGGWTMAPATPRTTILGVPPNKGMANFWGYPCVVTTPVTIDGVKYPMAMCAGPLNENPDNRPAPNGVVLSTNAAQSAKIPVGATTMTNGPLAGLTTWLLNPFNSGSGAGGSKSP